MLISLHKRAKTTTPKNRFAIRARAEPTSTVAERYAISEQAVWKWCARDDVHDRSQTPHRLQQMSPAKEAVSVAMRTRLMLHREDLLALLRTFLNPNTSRSGLLRCPRRRRIWVRLSAMGKAKTSQSRSWK